MPWQSVESTNLSNVDYDAEEQTLRIQFRDGSIYAYSSVPEAVFDALLAAPSKGRYFRSSIRNQFTYRRQA